MGKTGSPKSANQAQLKMDFFRRLFPCMYLVPEYTTTYSIFLCTSAIQKGNYSGAAEVGSKDCLPTCPGYRSLWTVSRTPHPPFYPAAELIAIISGRGRRRGEASSSGDGDMTDGTWTLKPHQRFITAAISPMFANLVPAILRSLEEYWNVRRGIIADDYPEDTLLVML